MKKLLSRLNQTWPSRAAFPAPFRAQRNNPDKFITGLLQAKAFVTAVGMIFVGSLLLLANPGPVQAEQAESDLKLSISSVVNLVITNCDTTSFAARTVLAAMHLM
ncbi:MAG: hypothetical protein LBU20_00430 [Candidatus Nomurabacteria bacterium]|jgi:hypothetical protein|nr:hypothetical protein [Candidatus Nomurabacteria bacterium]